jgi:hypothetical protein
MITDTKISRIVHTTHRFDVGMNVVEINFQLQTGNNKSIEAISTSLVTSNIDIKK